MFGKEWKRVEKSTVWPIWIEEGAFKDVIEIHLYDVCGGEGPNLYALLRLCEWACMGV